MQNVLCAAAMLCEPVCCHCTFSTAHDNLLTARSSPQGIVCFILLCSDLLAIHSLPLVRLVDVTADGPVQAMSSHLGRFQQHMVSSVLFGAGSKSLMSYMLSAAKGAVGTHLICCKAILWYQPGGLLWCFHSSLAQYAGSSAYIT